MQQLSVNRRKPWRWTIILAAVLAAPVVAFKTAQQIAIWRHDAGLERLIHQVPALLEREGIAFHIITAGGRMATVAGSGGHCAYHVMVVLQFGWTRDPRPDLAAERIRNHQFEEPEPSDDIDGPDVAVFENGEFVMVHLASGGFDSYFDPRC